jgi:hypothetical protein
MESGQNLNMNGDANLPVFWRFMERISYGLAGADFLTIVQLVSVPNVPILAICELIFFIPLLVTAADNCDTLAIRKLRASSKAGKRTLTILTIGAVGSVLGIGEVWGAFHSEFRLVLWASFLASFGVRYWINRSYPEFKKED